MPKYGLSILGNRVAEVETDRSLSENLASGLRTLQDRGTPQTYADTGADHGISDRFTGDFDRDLADLQKYEEIYQRGGPVAQLVDIRAHMVFGTGAEVVSDMEGAAEWLERQLPHLDSELIQIGKETYIYGDAFRELVETNAGQFARLVSVDPSTVEAELDEHGDVELWIQEVGRGRQKRRVEFPPDEVGHFRTLMPTGRSPYGISYIGRNIDEIERFAANQTSRTKFLRRHATPRLFVQVGRDGGPAIEDRTLKRVRSRFQRLDDTDDIIAGRDINAEYLDASTNDLDKMLEDDITLLAWGFGVPEEMAGLGRGSTEATAKVRLQAFEREARAQQRLLADQFAEQVLRPLLRDYSPFDADQADPRIDFADPVTDRMEDAEFVQMMGDIMTLEEARDRVGLGEHKGEEDELGVFEDGPTNQPDPFTGALSDGEDADTDDRELVLDSVSESDIVVEDLLLDMQKAMLWDEESDPDRALFQFADEEVPEFAKKAIRKAIESGAVFNSIESITPSERSLLIETLQDSLEEQHGWSLNSLRDNIREVFPEMDKSRAETIARTETNSIVNHAREIGYEEREDAEDLTFRWVGPTDDRTTEACEYIKGEIPDSGVSMQRLKELIEEANEQFVDHAGRELTPHINCRHTFVRATGNRAAAADEETNGHREHSHPISDYAGGDWVVFEHDGRERMGRIIRTDAESIELNGEVVTGESGEPVYEIEMYSTALERAIGRTAKPERAVRRTGPPDGVEEGAMVN